MFTLSSIRLTMNVLNSKAHNVRDKMCVLATMTLC